MDKPEETPEAKKRGRPKQCVDVKTYNREYYHKMCKKEHVCAYCNKTLWSTSSIRRHIRVSQKCELARSRILLDQIKSRAASSATLPSSAKTPSRSVCNTLPSTQPDLPD